MVGVKSGVEGNSDIAGRQNAEIGSAPPWVRWISPCVCKASKSLRTVTCDVSNLFARSRTSTRPSRFTISRIARRRSSLSKNAPAAGVAAHFPSTFFLYRLLSFVQGKEIRRVARRRINPGTCLLGTTRRGASPKNQAGSPRNSSRTLRDRACRVKGFCKKVVPGSSTPWCTRRGRAL